MFLPSKNEIYTEPLKENGVRACRKTNCGIKAAGVHLGRTLPSLLDEGCQASFSRKGVSLSTLCHYDKGHWVSWTFLELRQIAEELALGLHQHLMLEKGDRAALLMDSAVPFVMADIGCLLAQLVTVPMLPEQSVDTTVYMLEETAATVLFVSSLRQVEQLLPRLSELKAIRLIVLAIAADGSAADTTANKTAARSSERATQSVLKKRLAQLQWSMPTTVELATLETVRQWGQWSAIKAQALRTAILPQDIATIVYTRSSSGLPLGAMLTHENLSGSALAAFSTLPCLRKGPSEVALSFLPLHHIFARGFVYGSLSYGQSLYFSTPRRVMRHLRELRPTVFFTVPRLLEKVYEGWQDTLHAASVQSAPGALNIKQSALIWADRLAQRYRLDQPPSGVYRAQLWLARQTVLRPLRNLFGGQMQCFISGGAALSAEAMRLMSAAGLKLCQGYGLTEASSTLSFTRWQWSRAGTVGVPMPGVEMAIAPDGELMVRAPYVMQGYYRQPEATSQVLEKNGWLHTGDRGEFSPDGLLTLTGHKKGLFKLSIGEYVAPNPIEQALRQSALIQQALVVGAGRKFCGLLIFPDMAALAIQAQAMGVTGSHKQLMQHPQVLELYQALVDQLNADLPLWSTVKRFRLVNPDIVGASDSTDWADESDRNELYATFSQEIEHLYQPLSGQSRATSPTVSQAVHQRPQPIQSIILSLTKGRPNHV